MLWLGKLLMCLCGAANIAVQAVYYTHMLQLNAYRPERYLRWCRSHWPKLLSVRRLFVPVLLLAAAFLVRYSWQLYIGAAVLLLSAVYNWPPKAKKPLVVTARVKRLLIVEGVLVAGVLAAAMLVGMRGFLILMGVVSALPAGLVLLANVVLLPLEGAVNNHYIEDARRRLDEMTDLTVIGITGSYGKTSTKYFLYALLSARYNVLMTPESYNTTMGVVRTIRERLKPSHELFIVEMGAKKRGDIQEICDLVHPRYGVLTSIGPQHLETFKTIETVVATKFELVDSLPFDGVAFLNADNEYIRRHPVMLPTVYYATRPGEEAQYVASEVTVDVAGTSFTVTAPSGESRRFTTRLLGAHNIQNLTGCIAVAHTLGIPLEELVYPVRRLKPVPHRLELLSGGYIDDAYNSNPAGFRSALAVLKDFDAQRVLVTPGVVELGAQMEAINFELGAAAADCCDVAVLVGGGAALKLREGLLSAGFPESGIYMAKTLQDGLTFVRALPDAGRERIVLLENDLPDNF